MTRIDYAVNSKNTVSVKYQYFHYQFRNMGVGGFSLPERRFDRNSSYHIVQITETSTLNANALNEIRVQYWRNRFELVAASIVPTLNISDSFVGGGSSLGHTINETARWELQDFMQLQRGTHVIKLGGRLRGVTIEDFNPTNFNGQWSFAGSTTGLTSLQRYQLTLQLMRRGLTPAQIRSAGGGASQFSIVVGTPLATVKQIDVGVYAQDDWRVRPNLTLSYGLRYEIQTNASGKLGFAPRLSVAWAPGVANTSRTPDMVVRFGAGVFYNRFSEASTLTANRFDGVNVRQFIFSESANSEVPTDSSTLAVLDSFRCLDGSITPDCAATLPSLAGASATQQTVWRIAPNLRVPTVYVFGAQLERQLPHHFTLTVGGFAVRALNVIRSRDINAPIPGTITLANPTGIRANMAAGEINQIESSGRMSQGQLVVGFNSRLNSQFSVSGNYVLSRSMNDSDGQSGSDSPPFPRDSYDLQGEWGPASNDVRHRFSLFGTYSNPKLWKLVFAPLIVASSGAPFNIITGIDSNLDRQFTDRPSFAGLGVNCTAPFIRCTRYGNFNLVPAAGERIVPRNFGRGTGALIVNLRISRNFGFHAIGQAKAGGASQNSQRNTDQKKYNLTVSVAFHNLFNRANLAPPIGNLSSPLFGQSQSLTSFGGFSGSGSENAGNRRIYINLQFSF